MINAINFNIGPINKRVFNYCQTSVLFVFKGATLVDKRANRFYTLAGSPAWGPFHKRFNAGIFSNLGVKTLA